MTMELEKANTPRLVPDSQFPEDALKRSVQEQPKITEAPTNYTFTWYIASAADSVLPWGRNVQKRDQQLAEFWPTEPYLAGGLPSVSFRNATLDWEIKGGTEKVNQAVTDMLTSAMGRSSFGWVEFVKLFCEDLYSRDNGAFVEIIRDPGISERFQNENAPCIGIAHLDSNQCVRTGNPQVPVLYTDRQGVQHKLQWYQVIPFSDFPSSIEKMNGVGYCAVTRVLRLAQILRSIMVFKDEKVSGRYHKAIHFVSGVSRLDIADQLKREQELANNQGLTHYIQPAIMASLDPEKPVTTATIDLASLPDGFNFDEELKWYISGLALGFGVDYQEFAPLPSGNIGSASQSMILHRKSSGKNPAIFMRTLSEAFRNYGVLPRGCRMVFNDKNEQEELERQEVRTKAAEEYAIQLRSGFLSPAAARADAKKRGFYDDEILDMIPEDYGNDIVNPQKNPVGQIGGNTIREDAGRQDSGRQKQNAGARLRKWWMGE